MTAFANATFLPRTAASGRFQTLELVHPAVYEQRSLTHRRCKERNDSFARVSRLELMSDGQDQDDVFGGEPPVLRDIPLNGLARG